MQHADLIRMANQITTFFEAYPKPDAINGIAKHIHNSWERRMRDALKVIVDSGGGDLKPLCLEAMQIYFDGPHANGQRATVNPKTKAPNGSVPSFADGGGDAG